jgi:hypothetical protein
VSVSEVTASRQRRPEVQIDFRTHLALCAGLLAITALTLVAVLSLCDLAAHAAG